MMMHRFLLAAVLTLSLAFPGYSQKKSSKPTEIIILHVNDMHSKIDNLGKLKYLADSLKKTHPNVFLVSAGDNFTGNPVVDMLEDKGYPMIDLMNRCGFNVSAIGNHEFDLGQELLNKRMEQASFPFISSNIFVNGAILHQPKPYIILTTPDSIQLAVLGITQINDQGIPDTHPLKVQGLTFADGIGNALQYAYLKKQYGILIGLTHLGVEDDARLADLMPQLDLIIGGHSHSVIDTLLMVGGVRIVQAGSNLKYIGKTTLMVKDGFIHGKRDELIPITALKKSDPEMTDLIRKYNNNEEFSKVIAVAEKPIVGYGPLGSMMSDAIAGQLGLDIALLNRGGIRIDSLPQGNITMREIYSLDPFRNQVVKYNMSPAEIKSLILNAFNREKQIDLEVSGISYLVLTDQEGKCADVLIKDEKGKELDDKKLYSVGISNYVATTYTFDHHDTGESLNVTTDQLLIDYLKKMKKVSYSGINRTSVKKKK
ncbi:MAG: bifunctional UDP-sugar hydrolase/5'-nucleotidase [Bacteroidetes bacterium]|nr:bifunctional UDP-sugar hydrolase/5'-nucleotidase [Bacteroidota bacterium]